MDTSLFPTCDIQFNQSIKDKVQKEYREVNQFKSMQSLRQITYILCTQRGFSLIQNDLVQLKKSEIQSNHVWIENPESIFDFCQPPSIFPHLILLGILLLLEKEQRRPIFTPPPNPNISVLFHSGKVRTRNNCISMYIPCF